jgi:hypothetical protein
MPAVSKAQQRFMGMVHAADKGETPASPEVAKVSKNMKDSDAKDFASTKHAGLPDKVREQIKSVVREVIREKNGISEMNVNDVHYKNIMKLYDRGGSFTKKKVGAVVAKNPNASRAKIEAELSDADYREILQFEDELGLDEIREKYNSVNEGSHGMATKLLQSIVSGDSSRAEGTKMSKELAQHYIDWIRTSPFGKKNGNLPLDMLVKASFNWGIERGLDSKLKGELSKLKSTIKESVNEDVEVRDGKYRFYSKDGVGYLTYGGKEISSGDFDWDDGSSSYWMSHSSFKGQKGFDTGKDIIKYFKSKNITTESVTEEHDCGCNENHDCGCGGVHEHHINEDINADANGIAGLTASRANAVKDFIEKNNINSNKLYLSLKKGNLKDRMDFVTALVGKPGNPIQKKVIAQFSN